MDLSFKRFNQHSLLKQDDPVLNIQRRHYSKKMAGLMSKDEVEVVYIDEASFNLNINLNYGWSKRGSKIRRKSVNSKSVNYSLILAVSKARVLAYDLYEKGVKGSNFFHFVFSLLKAYEGESKPLLLIFDNCSTHKCKDYWPKVKDYLNVANTPPFTPQFSLVELVFGHIKQKVRRRNFADVNGLLAAIKNEIDSLDTNILKSYEKRVIHYLKKIFIDKKF